MATRRNVNKSRSHRLTARTPGFHPGNRSSILRGITFQDTIREIPKIPLYIAVFLVRRAKLHFYVVEPYSEETHRESNFGDFIA